MTTRNTPDSDIKSPEESLSHYFDDLLGIGDVIEEAFAVIESSMHVAANAGSARVVNLPAKKSALENPKNISAEATAKPRALTKRERKVTVLADPEVVQTPEQKRQLEKLLQSASAQLLTETPVIKTVAETVKADVAPALLEQPKNHFVADASEIQEWDISTTVEVATEPPESDDAVATIAEFTGSQFQMEGLEWMENGRPQWAQSRFDVLLFKVAGLTLAVPLVSLGQIQPLTDELTPLFGQADWFMGLQPTPAGKIRTVNTAKFVMPERYDEIFLQTARYVMSINSVPWGLAVDSVNQPITLNPDDVKWRGDRSKRPWLAGTVKDHMCALLDIPRIGQMLINADKNFVSV